MNFHTENFQGGHVLSDIHHPVRLDTSTEKMLPSSALLTKNSNAPIGSFSLTFSPETFLHAYALLGKNPQRYGSDLSQYLATVNDFFDRRATIQTAFLSLVGITQTDAKKRLSEDLSVALCSLFMVDAFGVTWDTVAQIPLNSKLSRKRPDFEGFDIAGNRHLFEAKGTTNLAGVEKALIQAISQVKSYPEAAITKLAIVSFLSTDDRLFPSQTFVVDPPSLPDNIPPTKRVAQLLHGEKVLQFAGLPQTAAAYLKALSVMLKEEPSDDGVPSFSYTWKFDALSSILEEENKQNNLQAREVNGEAFVGRNIFEGKGVRIFAGATRGQMEALTKLKFLSSGETYLRLEGEDRQSFFSDGTCLIIENA